MRLIKNIVLDFGHGGIDPNGIYTTAPSKMYKHTNGEIAYEGILNRQIGKYLLELLDDDPNMNIIVTTPDYKDVSLKERVNIANSYNKDETLFISIHCNAGKGEGFEIFTSKGITESDKLAEDIAVQVEYLFKDLNKSVRFDYSDGYRDKEENFYVLKNTKCPAVLIECGFFDNYEEFKLLSDPLYQRNLAIQFYIGIIKYLKDVKKN